MPTSAGAAKRVLLRSDQSGPTYNPSTNIMSISGNLGVGSSTAPSVPLDVTGAASISGNLNMNSNRIFGIPDSPSADNDATSKKYVDTATNNMTTYVDTKTTDMATNSAVSTAIMNALAFNGSMVNHPSITRTDEFNDGIYLTGVPASDIGLNGITARGKLYLDTALYYNPYANTLSAGRFNGTLHNSYIMADDGVATGVYGTTSGWMLRIQDGLVGIGSGTTANAPLHVFSNRLNNTAVGSERYYAFDAAGSNVGGGAAEIAIISESGIWIKASGTGGRLWLTSDERIKTNIVNLNADKMMNILRNMRPVSFDFIDPMKNVNKKHFGFIAQEVNEVLPEGISLNTDVIPNNMTKGEIDKSSKIEASFTLKPDDTDISLNYLLLTTDTSLNFDTANPYSSSNVYKFKIYCGEKWAKEQDIYIRSDYNVIDNKYTYVIGMKKDVYDIVITEPTLFVYGQYVYDLHILGHDTIYTVATAALQEVDRQQQADKVRIAELEATVAEQQSLINDILERLNKAGL